jgi:hypothetical protein
LNGEHHDHDDHERASGAGAPPGDEEELRARLEEELKKITVRDVLVQTVVTLINLGGQRLGLSEAGREASDPDQTRVAIEAVRALLPLLESDQRNAEQVKPVRDALAQLQMAYAQQAGTPAGTPERAGAGSRAAEQERPQSTAEPPSARPGPSGGLWVPPGTKT